MARPSLKPEKTEQILQAYERCIAMYGVEGATLQKVAEQAGMARPLLRHYVGNQEDLLAQSVERYFERQSQELAGFQTIASVDMLLDALFNKGSHGMESDGSDENDIMIASAFTLAAAQHTDIQEKLNQWFTQFLSSFQKVLEKLFNNTDKGKIRSVCVGLTGIYFNLYAMQPVESNDDFFDDSRKAAQMLLASLHD